MLCRWRDYSLLHCWTSMSQLFPEAQYLRHTPCPLVTTLPTQYRWGGGRWDSHQLVQVSLTSHHEWLY
jgi:hypothetical protein